MLPPINIEDVICSRPGDCDLRDFLNVPCSVTKTRLRQQLELARQRDLAMYSGHFDDFYKVLVQSVANPWTSQQSMCKHSINYFSLRCGGSRCARPCSNHFLRLSRCCRCLLVKSALLSTIFVCASEIMSLRRPDCILHFEFPAQTLKQPIATRCI